MANIKEAMKILFEVEFNNKPERFLHHNHGEDGWTLGGVYQKANPTKINWSFIENLFAICHGDLERVSIMLYHDKITMDSVVKVFENSYWIPLRLNAVYSQKIANEIFLMGVVAGIGVGAKLAQRAVGAKDDGIIGQKTLEVLNTFDEDEFSAKFDLLEVEYFASLVYKNPKYARFMNGWKFRSYYV